MKARRFLIIFAKKKQKKKPDNRAFNIKELHRIYVTHKSRAYIADRAKSRHYHTKLSLPPILYQ